MCPWRRAKTGESGEGVGESPLTEAGRTQAVRTLNGSQTDFFPTGQHLEHLEVLNEGDRSLSLHFSNESPLCEGDQREEGAGVGRPTRELWQEGTGLNLGSSQRGSSDGENRAGMTCVKCRRGRDFQWVCGRNACRFSKQRMLQP